MSFRSGGEGRWGRRLCVSISGLSCVFVLKGCSICVVVGCVCRCTKKAQSSSPNTVTSNVSTRPFAGFPLPGGGGCSFLDSYMGVAINRVCVKLTTRSKNKPVLGGRV